MRVFVIYLKNYLMHHVWCLQHALILITNLQKQAVSFGNFWKLSCTIKITWSSFFGCELVTAVRTQFLKPSFCEVLYDRDFDAVVLFLVKKKKNATMCRFAPG